MQLNNCDINPGVIVAKNSSSALLSIYIYYSKTI